MRDAVSLLTLIAVSATTLLGQSADWQSVRNLPRGTAILLKVKSGERYLGDVRNVTPTAISIETDERGHPGRTHRQHDFSASEVSQIRLQKRGASLLTMIAIGAGVGVGIGAGIDAAARSNEDRGLATAVFGFLGAMLGLLLGRHSTMVKGEVVYQAS